MVDTNSIKFVLRCCYLVSEDTEYTYQVKVLVLLRIPGILSNFFAKQFVKTFSLGFRTVCQKISNLNSWKFLILIFKIM